MESDDEDGGEGDDDDDRGLGVRDESGEENWDLSSDSPPRRRGVEWIYAPGTKSVTFASSANRFASSAKKLASPAKFS
jgi:hypothetical protein